jgi:hypothetical protein
MLPASELGLQCRKDIVKVEKGRIQNDKAENDRD